MEKRARTCFGLLECQLLTLRSFNFVESFAPKLPLASSSSSELRTVGFAPRADVVGLAMA
jgi:hypothetical protein